MGIFTHADERQAAREVLWEVMTRVKKLGYKPNEEEVKALSGLSRRMAIWSTVWGSAACLGTYQVLRKLQPAGGWARPLTVGCAAGVWAAGFRVQAFPEDTLRHLLAMPTPIGGEATALLAIKRPQSPLLEAQLGPPMEGAPARPRVASTADLQKMLEGRQDKRKSRDSVALPQPHLRTVPSSDGVHQEGGYAAADSAESVSESNGESMEALLEPFTDNFFGDELKEESSDFVESRNESFKSRQQQRKELLRERGRQLQQQQNQGRWSSPSKARGQTNTWDEQDLGTDAGDKFSNA